MLLDAFAFWEKLMAIAVASKGKTTVTRGEFNCDFMSFVTLKNTVGM